MPDMGSYGLALRVIYATTPISRDAIADDKYSLFSRSLERHLLLDAVGKPYLLALPNPITTYENESTYCDEATGRQRGFAHGAYLYDTSKTNLLEYPERQHPPLRL